MPENKVVQVFMTVEEAEMFKYMLERYDMFALITANRILDQKNASIAFNFDSKGILQSINRSDSLFKRRYNLTQNNTLL